MCGTRILLVDDEEDVTRILAKRLERRGYSCGRAANGQEAVEAMEGECFPIVVLDGMGALQRIAERWPKTQIILLSGHADMQLAVQAMTQGAFGYLMKPVDFDDLLFKIEDAAMQSRLEYGNEATGR